MSVTNPIINKVITGGQTGADQGALRAALAAGIPTGGWIPKGYLTEDGPNPELASYGLTETEDADYAKRTRMNVSEATGCIWFGNPHSPGGCCTISACSNNGVDSFVVVHTATAQDVADWIIGYLHEGETRSVVLMIAGNRESKQPGIADRVEKFMTEVFRLLPL